MASTAAASSPPQPTAPSKKAPTESEIYDRQIRLWGAEAQNKMRNSKVLYIHVTGVSSEIIKNLVLAGIAATVCDPRPAAILQDECRCFFTPLEQQPASKKMKYDSVAHAAQPLIEELNPLLGHCPLITKPVDELTEDDLKDFTVVVASQIPMAEAVRLSQIVTQQQEHAFYVADCFGLHGAAMLDLGKDFQYRPEIGKALGDPTPLKDYVPLSEMIKVPLHRAVNRFHKQQPPPTWIMYRCLLEYHQHSKRWLGNGDDDDSIDPEKVKGTIETFLKEQQVSLTDEQVADLVQAGMAQVAPVCAVLGGVVGNEVIKIITGKGEPANNSLLLDGNSCKVWTFLVKAKE